MCNVTLQLVFHPRIDLFKRETKTSTNVLHKSLSRYLPNLLQRVNGLRPRQGWRAIKKILKNCSILSEILKTRRDILHQHPLGLMEHNRGVEQTLPFHNYEINVTTCECTVCQFWFYNSNSNENSSNNNHKGDGKFVHWDHLAVNYNNRTKMALKLHLCTSLLAWCHSLRLCAYF